MDETRQFWLLRRYLRDHKISKSTGHRVYRYLEYAYARQSQRVQEKDVTLLQLLTGPLREEVKHESFAPLLIVHPLFHQLSERTKIFTCSLSAVFLARGDVHFSYGQQADAMSFVTDGELQFSIGDDVSEDDNDRRPSGISLDE